MRPLHSMLIAAAVCLTTAASTATAEARITTTGAAAASQDELSEIRQRFKERYRDLFQLKVDGRVGEGFGGHVHRVASFERFGPDEERRITALLDDENRDRKRFYELLAEDVREEIADEGRRRVTAETVARRNAERNFRNARPEELLRMADGVWVRKADEADYEKVLALKSDGLVGESPDGTLAVREADAVATRTARRENDRREDFYEQIARRTGKTPAAVAALFGKEHVEAARPDDWVRTAGGDWIRAK